MFEVLCVDTTGTTVLESEENLLYSLMANGSLWDNPKITKTKLTDGDHCTRQNLQRVSSRRAQRGEIPVVEAFLNLGDPSRAFGMTR